MSHETVVLILFFFFFKQKTAYEMRISDWSSDVCSSDLPVQLVLLILLVFSFLSWVIIIRKYTQTKAALEDAEAFEERFWSGGDLAQLFREVSNGSGNNGGIENIFEPGFREFASQRQRDRKSTRLNSSHSCASRIPSSA